MLSIFAGDASLDMVCPFTAGMAATKTNSMYILFVLIPYVIGQNLTPKTAIQVLKSVMSSLGLKCKPLIDFLLVAATYTTGNRLPATIQDDTELGVEPPLRLFKVINHCRQTILRVQLLVLLPGTDGTKATAALQTAAQAVSEMRFAVVEDKNQRRIEA